MTFLPQTRETLDTGLVTLTSGATVNTDCSLGNVFKLTLATNATLANPTNLEPGAHYIWIINQDTTGSRTLSYGSAFQWLNAAVPILSTAAGKTDIITALSNGTNVFAVLANNFF